MERISGFSEIKNTEMVETIPCINQIIDACRKNDLKAQLYLYKLYYREMFNLSLSIVMDRMLAEDIMQESILLAFDKIGSCSGIISFDMQVRNIVETRSLSSLNKTK